MNDVLSVVDCSVWGVKTLATGTRISRNRFARQTFTAMATFSCAYRAIAFITEKF
jgi:hypothetical protein